MATTLTQVKALVTVPADTIADTDIEAILQVEPALYAAAAAVCRRLASFFADSFDVSSAGQRAMLSQRHHHYLSLALQFDRQQSSNIAQGCATGTDGDHAFTSTTFEPRDSTA